MTPQEGDTRRNAWSATHSGPSQKAKAMITVSSRRYLSWRGCKPQPVPDAYGHKEHGCLLGHALPGCIPARDRYDWEMSVHHMPACHSPCHFRTANI